MAIDKNGQLYFTFAEQNELSTIEAYQIMTEPQFNMYDIFIRNIESIGLDLSDFNAKFYLTNKRLYCVAYDSDSNIFDYIFLGGI